MALVLLTHSQPQSQVDQHLHYFVMMFHHPPVGMMLLTDREKHERVGKALAQVNSMVHRLYPRRLREEKKQVESSSEEEFEQEQEEAAAHETAELSSSPVVMTLDDQIDQILQKTRTMALLRITTTKEEKESEEEGDNAQPSIKEKGQRAFSKWRIFRKKSSVRYQPTSISRRSSVKSHVTADDDDEVIESDDEAEATGPTEEQIAAMRLARRLSTFLSLPKAISYHDLEDITESLLNEPPSPPKTQSQQRRASSNALLFQEPYADEIDQVVDDSPLSPTSSFGGDDPTWKRRASTQHMDQTDLDALQRRLSYHRSSKVLSSQSLLRGASSRRLSMTSSSASLVSKSSTPSLHAQASWKSHPTAVASDCGPSDPTQPTSPVQLAEEGSEESSEQEDDDDKLMDPSNYDQWRNEIKEDYMSWIKAKLEAKQRRKLKLKLAAQRKPRWLLLYEASIRPNLLKSSPTEAEPPSEPAPRSSSLSTKRTSVSRTSVPRQSIVEKRKASTRRSTRLS